MRTVTQCARKHEGQAARDDDVAQICLDRPLGSRPTQLLTELMQKAGEAPGRTSGRRRTSDGSTRGAGGCSSTLQVSRLDKTVEVRFSAIQNIADAQRLLARQTVMVIVVMIPLTIRSEALEAAMFRRPG